MIIDAEYPSQRNYPDCVVIWPGERHVWSESITVDLLIHSWRREGIEESLAGRREILKYDGGDRQGVRGAIPGLSIRLGRD